MQRHNIDIIAKLRQRMKQMLGKSHVVKGLHDNMLSTQSSYIIF